MEITYIGHSGFLIEWENCYWLFDYYIGDIPKMNSNKKILVFSSHKHRDHFNPKIFRLFNTYQDIEYVLSSDINPLKQNYEVLGVTNKILDKILLVKPSTEYNIYDKNNEKIVLKTLKSTDCGVAFLLYYEGKIIYHAGDLNQWIWKEESKQNNNNMTAKFNKEMEQLSGLRIDIAFVPLDPRQEEYYYMGMESLINTANVTYIFPMHFWEQASIIQQFKRERNMNGKNTEIMDIDHNGQMWKIETKNH